MNKSASLFQRWSGAHFLQLLIVAICGGLNVFAFAPYGQWWIQITGMGVLFLLLAQAASMRRAVLLAWVYGSFSSGVTVFWITTAMSVYGGMPMLLAVLALALLAMFLGAYTALFAWLARRIQARAGLASSLLLAVPACWVLSEWLRGWLFTGFPWDIAGYAHTASPLAGYAPLLGVYGLSYLSAALSAMLAWVACGNSKLPQRIVVLLCMTVLIAGGRGLQQHRWTTDMGRPLTVRLLQGNVAQDMKFNEAHLLESLSLYYSMITSKPADLIVTPETALPIISAALPPDYLSRLNEFVQQTGSALLLGLAVQDAPDVYTNTMLGFSRDYSARNYRYDKAHLLPFGEFIPPGFRWFVKMMNIPIGDFKSGGWQQPPMKVGDQYVMPDICYESLFGEEIAGQLNRQAAAGGPVASILLNASNLAWYDDSVAMPQHLQFATMRVLETGRPWIAATNTGATAVISADGQTRAQAPYLQKFSLEASVQGTSGLTPYIRFGNWPVLIIAAALLLLTWLKPVRQRS